LTLHLVVIYLFLKVGLQFEIYNQEKFE
jgi:hypothetical protein